MLPTDVGSAFLNFLIGGPNQSHKVNFKEPSLWERGSKKNRSDIFVNTFSEELFHRLCGEGTRSFFAASWFVGRPLWPPRWRREAGTCDPPPAAQDFSARYFSPNRYTLHTKHLNKQSPGAFTARHPAMRPRSRDQTPLYPFRGYSGFGPCLHHAGFAGRMVAQGFAPTLGHVRLRVRPLFAVSSVRRQTTRTGMGRLGPPHLGTPAAGTSSRARRPVPGDEK